MVYEQNFTKVVCFSGLKLVIKWRVLFSCRLSTKERILICQESALKSSKMEKTSFIFLIYNVLLLDAFYFHIFVRHSIFA